MSEILEHVEHFQRRVLLDALLEAWGPYWERRAEAFEAARPRPEDYHGRATPAELRAQWQRLTEIAAACRARAQLSPLELVTEDLDNVLEEIA